jgi:hypothetical protein
VEKLLEIGGYLNKGYLVFIENYFVSVPLVCHLHQLSAYITGTVKRNRKVLPQQFKNKFVVGQKCIADLGPFLHMFSARRPHKNMVTYFSPATPQPKKRKYREDMATIHK